ncbi:MAG: penicillin-binding protein 2 [Proteobacteria bacterium]|nr:MAG: penicillin-binding protein 2 [Pseudomonadota bacterium]
MSNQNNLNHLYWQLRFDNKGNAVKNGEAIREFSKVRDRTSIVNYLALLLTICLILRLVYLDTVRSAFLENQLNSRVMRTITLPAMRGTITDRNEQPLAVSTPVEAIWADPSELNSLTAAQLSQLADTLGVKISEISKKLDDKNKTFVYLKRSLPPENAKAVLSLGIPGVYSMQEYKRFYPSAEVTAHVVGFNNIDDRGADGIEYADDKLLLGHDGSKQIVRDLRGHVVEAVTQQKASNGKQVQLALDSRIQYIVYNALKNQVDLSKAKGGSAVVLDAKTGEVLAMVNLPTYNPNNRDGVTPEMLKNRAATNVFDPGSIMKPLVVAKALDDRIVTPNTVFDTHPYAVGPKLIKDDHAMPSMTVAQIIQYSSDIGTSKIAMKYSPESMWSYYRQIGFGQKLGTGFPGETKGILLPWKRWYPVDQALMSFGYGISVSLFQMAHAYTLFTNSGCMLPVTFTKLENDKNLQCEQVIAPNTAETMRKILASVTEEGTGKKAQAADYTTAGKTGTAQVLDNGRYRNDRHVGSFVGFAPATNPRLIVAVMIDQPSTGSYYGAQTAAPVFAQIVQPALHVLKVKPDKSPVATP